MQQATEEIDLGKSKLVKFVRRLTDCLAFPNIRGLAKVAEYNDPFLELLTGAVSAVYHAGKQGTDMDEGMYLGLPGEASKDEIVSFLNGVYNKGKKESGRLKKYPLI